MYSGNAMKAAPQSSISVAGFVLTGGKSSRMGQDKALLKLGGKPLALRAAEQLQPLAAEVFLVGDSARYAGPGFPVLDDCVRDKGPLAGIVTALGYSRRDWNLILACDLPFVEARFLQLLITRAASSGECHAVVPVNHLGWQPLCAVYHRRCLPVFEEVLGSPKPKISLAYPRLQVEAIKIGEQEEFAFPERMFKNINTPDDLKEAQRRLEGNEPEQEGSAS